ncbi:MAG: PAS domain-containing sensor histidine kinase [Ardenticatenales bacterium]|nr:PAS domain-containing sensor histidine kinase [Ardenticatenales bacterium]
MNPPNDSDVVTKRLSRWWERLITPSIPVADERQRLNSELLLVLAVAAFVVGVPLGLIPVFLGNWVTFSQSATWIILAPVFPAVIIGVAMNRRGHVRFASWLIILSSVFCLYLGTLWEAPLTGTLTMYYLVIPLYLSSLFFSAGEVVLITVVCLVLYLSYPVVLPSVSFVDVINGPARLLLMNGVFITLYARFRDTLETRRQRKLTQKELQEQLLLDVAFDGVLIHESWRIREISQGGAAILGYTPAELAGKDFLTFLLEASRTVLLEGGHLHRPVELIGCQPDGTQVDLELVGRQYRLDGADVALAAFRDISERKARQRETELAQLFSQALRRGESRQALPPIILENLCTLVPAEAACLFQLQVDQTLQLERLHGAVRLTDPAASLMESSLGRVFTNKTILRNEAALLESPCQGDFAAQIMAPLLLDNEPVGALWLGRQNRFSAADERNVANLARISAAALTRSARHEATRDYAQQLEERVQERTQALSEANEQLRALDQLKSKFIADVSHELRTPITNLTLYLELLEQGREDKRPMYRERLGFQIDRLTQLVDDVFNLSRLESGQVNMTMDSVDLNGLLQSELAALADELARKGLSVALATDADVPMVWGDDQQLSIVIKNILSNALNYTDQGQITVATFWPSREDLIGLRISDTGRGIGPADLPHVMDRFYRGQSTEQSNIPGTGLGLAIAQEIINLHDGKIEIQSELAMGTTVTIWLWPAFKKALLPAA